MTQPGYEDYARTSLATGKLLARGSQVFSTTTNLYFGYVGPWPYINMFMNITGGNRHYLLQFNYYSDDTFTTLIAGTQSVRQDNNNGYQQYKVLSPYLSVTIIPDSGTPGGNILYAIYGTTGKASAADLATLASNGIEQVNAILSGQQSNFTLVEIVPGPWTVTWGASVAPCFFQLQRYDWNSAALVEFWEGSIEVINQSKSAIIQFPDAPIAGIQFNRGGANGTCKTFAYPMSD